MLNSESISSWELTLHFLFCISNPSSLQAISTIWLVSLRLRVDTLSDWLKHQLRSRPTFLFSPQGRSLLLIIHTLPLLLKVLTGATFDIRKPSIDMASRGPFGIMLPSLLCAWRASIKRPLAMPICQLAKRNRNLQILCNLRNDIKVKVKLCKTFTWAEANSNHGTWEGPKALRDP